MSLYDDIGGGGVLSAAVDDFLARAVADQTFAPWFDGLTRLQGHTHVMEFLAVALDGPENYTGHSMRQAHSGLMITGFAFDAILGHLCDALAAVGVDEQAARRTLHRVELLRPVIVELPGT